MGTNWARFGHGVPKQQNHTNLRTMYEPRKTPMNSKNHKDQNLNK